MANAGHKDAEIQQFNHSRCFEVMTKRPSVWMAEVKIISRLTAQSAPMSFCRRLSHRGQRINAALMSRALHTQSAHLKPD